MYLLRGVLIWVVIVFVESVHGTLRRLGLEPLVGDRPARQIAFFAGTAAFAIPLMRRGSRLGWAAALMLLGALLVLAEILSAQVILSQIGNILVFCGSATAAWLILRGATGETAEST